MAFPALIPTVLLIFPIALYISMTVCGDILYCFGGMWLHWVLLVLTSRECVWVRGDDYG